MRPEDVAFDNAEYGTYDPKYPSANHQIETAGLRTLLAPDKLSMVSDFGR